MGANHLGAKNGVTSETILEMISQGEGQLIEWKDSRILSDSFKLARSISALANTKGGFVLIGVKDNGSLEGLKFKKEHETQIMSISSEKVNPPIRIDFTKVSILGQGDVYAIRVPDRGNKPFHGVKTRDGLVYFTRVGSTIRELQPNELSRGTARRVKIEPYSPSDKGSMILTEKMVTRLSEKVNWSFDKAILFLTLTGVLVTVMTLGVLMALIYGAFGFSVASVSIWAYVPIVIGLFIGIYLISTLRIARETKCPVCKRYFKYKIVQSEILEKRNVDRDTEEWKILNIYRCESCGHEEENTDYEEHSKD